MSMFKSFWQDSSNDHASSTQSSLIPLPTVSTLLERPKSTSSPKRGSYDPSDPFLPLQRAESALQRQIQDLLDAQSHGLFPDSQQDAQSRKRSGRPAPSQALSLSDARNGLITAMQSLTGIKAKQVALIQKRTRAIQAASAQLQLWDDKQSSLEAEMQTARETSDNDDMKRLNDEDRSLQNQIDGLETQLAELRSQQRVVRHRLSERDNALNSRIASFKQSLTLVESERKTFLRRPPLDLFRSIPPAQFVSLKPESRSIQLAADALQSAREAETRGLESANIEQQALQEGVKIWSSILEKVTDMETAIKEELKELAAADQSHAQQSMQRLRQQLDGNVHDLEQQLSDAEAKGRSLLVCCIGAELEALHNGQQLLRQVASASSTVVQSPPESTAPDSPAHEFKGPLLSGTASNTDESDADPENLLIARRETNES